jgi:hypothetical protein
VCAKTGLRNFMLAIRCEDDKRSGRPLMVDDDQIKTLIENNQRYATREIAEIINVSKDRCEPLAHAWLRISVRYLGTSQFEQKKFNGPHFHLRFIAQTQ